LRISEIDTTQDVHETFCPLCGFDAEELTVGTVLKYYSESGELLGYGHPGGVFAQDLITKDVLYTTTPLDDSERAPAGGPCVDCAEDISNQRAEFKDEVEKGGLHWHCTECGLWGVIIHNDSKGFAAGVRKQAGIAPPAHLGVKFINCSQHAAEDTPEPDGMVH